MMGANEALYLDIKAILHYPWGLKMIRKQELLSNLLIQKANTSYTHLGSFDWTKEHKRVAGEMI